MTKQEEKKISKTKFSSNNFIVIGLVVIFVWLTVANIWELNLSRFNSLLTILLLNLPIIFGSFSLAYGLGAKSNDKMGTITITLLLGALLSYTFSTPVATYINFIRYFF